MTWENRLVFERGGFYSSNNTFVFPTFNLYPTPIFNA